MSNEPGGVEAPTFEECPVIFCTDCLRRMTEKEWNALTDSVRRVDYMYAKWRCGCDDKGDGIWFIDGAP